MISDHEMNIQADPDWTDILGIENDLSTEEILVKKTAHDYASQKLFPIVTDAFNNEIFDKSIIKELGELGLIAPTISSKYGGAELNNVCHGLIAYEIERVDSGYRSAMSVQSSLVIHPINEFGSDKQKNKYIPELIKGNLIGCFGLTEPDHGSDPSSMQTTAKKVDGGWKISGTKTWITNAPIADIAIIWAKTDENILKGFILDRNQHNIETKKIEGKFSLRTSETGEIHMNEIFVSDDYLLPGVSGFKGPFSCLNKARYGIAWGVMGAAEFCWEKSLEYTLDRNQFNAPLASKQLIQKKLADMQTEISLGMQAALRVGRLIDENNFVPEMISLIKRNNCQKALEIARSARDIHGGNGISDEYHVVRHSMNLEAVNTYEGTSDIHALILGQKQTNISSF